MKNNNQEVMRRLSMRSLKNNRMRNAFAIAAIALTCMLFSSHGNRNFRCHAGVYHA